MLKKLLITGLLGIIMGCMSAPVPKDQKGAYRGKGRVVSIITTAEHYQEVAVEIDTGEHLVVMVKAPTQIFPNQKVRIQRQSGGFGTVTPE